MKGKVLSMDRKKNNEENDDTKIYIPKSVSPKSFKKK